MRQPMTSRERLLVALVACLVLAIVPMTALAATGQLVNIVDGTDVGRVAKVSAGGALLVEARPALPDSGILARGSRNTKGYLVLLAPTSPRNMAITEISVAVATSNTVQVRLRSFLIPATSSCASPTSITSMYDMRYLVAPAGTTLQQTFNPPLRVLAAPAGKEACVVFYITSVPQGTVFGGLSGFNY